MADNHEYILKFYGHILLQKNQGLDRGTLYGTCETRECPQRSQLLEDLMTRKFKELQLQQSHDGRHQAQTIAYSFL